MHELLLTQSTRLIHRLAPMLLLLASACQLPNVTPFVDATGQLKSAVGTSGTAVQNTLEQTQGQEENAKAFAAEWQARNATMAALLRYANSLDAIVAAGKSGAEAADKIADSVKALSGAVGIALPGAEVTGVITDTGRFIFAQLSTVRAANSLARAMEEAQPAIEQIAQKLRKDLEDADAIIRSATTKIETGLVNSPENRQLDAYRKSIATEMQKHGDPAIKTQRDAMAELAKTLADTEPRWEAYQKKLREAEDRMHAARDLIVATGSSLDAWSNTHALLATAARNKTLASATDLTAAASELRNLVKRLRDL